MTYKFPNAALTQHIAILGKTGSGKTTTAKLAVEQVVATGARVCILDPIKSDWWGITVSADGKSEGLPFDILGGPRGHVPLASSLGPVVGKLVAEGTLPLSIIDMADFEAGGAQKFFIAFAEALMKHARGVVYLVLEEAHEFAPKERAGFGQENMAIHFAKKLATAGRSKGVRLILATQRVQSLHNALLGSCETMIVHRMTAPADQEPVKKWLQANAPKNITGEVQGSLSSLKTGTAWLCSGEAAIFDKVTFPRIKTYDNSATPTDDDARHLVQPIKTNRDRLLTLLAIPKEAPKLDAQNGSQIVTPDPAAIESARLSGYEQGIRAAAAHIRDTNLYWSPPASQPETLLQTASKHPVGATFAQDILSLLGGPEPSNETAKTDIPIPEPAAPRRAPVPAAPPIVATSGNHPVPGPQARVLDALAWWRGRGWDTVKREQVAAIAGYSVRSGNFGNLLSKLSTDGMVDYPQPGYVRAIGAGVRTVGVGGRNGIDIICDKIRSSQQRIVRQLYAQKHAITREVLAEAAGYQASSGNFGNLLSSLRTLGLIDYPNRGSVKLEDWVRQ